MNINILLCFENAVYEAGVTSIIKTEILGTNIKNVEKSNLINNPDFKYFDFLIIQIENDGKKDLNLITKLLLVKTKAKIIVFAKNNLNIELFKLINYGAVGLMLNTSTRKDIISNLTSKLKCYAKHKYNQTKGLNNLLSKREYEIGLMWISGDKTAIISKKTNLATTTIYTYKNRILEKTKVDNIFELAALYYKKNEVLEEFK